MAPVDLIGARRCSREGSPVRLRGVYRPGPGLSGEACTTEGPIAQPGVAYTVINTRFDELGLVLAPTDTRLEHEPGVDFTYVPDVFPLDPVGHIGLASDPGVYGMAANALDGP